MNPIVHLIESPAEALTQLGWLCVLLAALIATWWAAGRNALALDKQWQEGWLLLIPFWPAVRIIAMFVIAAIDLWLFAAILKLIG